MYTLLLVSEINNIKIANILIKKRLILNQTLYRYIKYNPTYKIK